MTALRNPDHGCPWDIEQTHQSIKTYAIEEAYEVVDAIDHGDDDALKNELGDLLLQVVFHAQIASEEKRFDFDAIAQAISDKMIARHPHVFGDAGKRTAKEQTLDWERIKAGEREEKGEVSALDGVARALPALTRAYKLQKRAARVGFDWNDISKVRDKINEELDELENAKKDAQKEEFGDVLFAMVNFGRHLGIDPEEALSLTNAKFVSRFRHIEKEFERENLKLEPKNLDKMEKHWQKAKSKE